MSTNSTVPMNAKKIGELYTALSNQSTTKRTKLSNISDIPNDR